MPELVLYGIKMLAKQFLGTVLDIEVDQSDSFRKPVILMPLTRFITEIQIQKSKNAKLYLKYLTMRIHVNTCKYCVNNIM